MGTLDFAQQGVGSVVPSRGMAAENAGSTLRSDEVGNAQERCRATSARGNERIFRSERGLGRDVDPTVTRARRAELASNSEVIRSGSRGAK